MLRPHCFSEHNRCVLIGCCQTRLASWWMDGLAQHSVTNIHCHSLHSTSQYRTPLHTTAAAVAAAPTRFLHWFVYSGRWQDGLRVPLYTQSSRCVQPRTAPSGHSTYIPTKIHAYDIQQEINQGIKDNTRIEHCNNYFNYCCYDIQQLLQFVTHNTYQQQQ